MIAAAQVFTQLLTNGQQKPEHERQIRPLIGLTAEQAQAAWQRAVEKAEGRKITAAIVKAAVKELQPTDPAKTPKAQPRQSKAKARQLISETIGQLLVMLSQKADHTLLSEKVQILHTQVQALFALTIAAKRRK